MIILFIWGQLGQWFLCGVKTRRKDMEHRDSINSSQSFILVAFEGLICISPPYREHELEVSTWLTPTFIFSFEFRNLAFFSLNLMESLAVYLCHFILYLILFVMDIQLKIFNAWAQWSIWAIPVEFCIQMDVLCWLHAGRYGWPNQPPAGRRPSSAKTNTRKSC